MDIEIKASFELDAEHRTLLETRLRELATRMGPFTRVTIEIEKSFLSGYAIAGEIGIPPTWTVRPSSDGGVAKLEDAIDRFHSQALTLIRHVIWARDGVPNPCRWCGAEEFVFVREPADATGSESSVTFHAERKRLVRARGGTWYGELESLVCRTCGHVEWFASDPLSIPIEPTEGVVLVKLRAPATPYRG